MTLFDNLASHGMDRAEATSLLLKLVQIGRGDCPSASGQSCPTVPLSNCQKETSRLGKFVDVHTPHLILVETRQQYTRKVVIDEAKEASFSELQEVSQMYRDSDVVKPRDFEDGIHHVASQSAGYIVEELQSLGCTTEAIESRCSGATTLGDTHVQRLYVKWDLEDSLNSKSTMSVGV